VSGRPATVWLACNTTCHTISCPHLCHTARILSCALFGLPVTPNGTFQKSKIRPHLWPQPETTRGQPSGITTHESPPVQQCNTHMPAHITSSHEQTPTSSRGQRWQYAKMLRATNPRILPSATLGHSNASMISCHEQTPHLVADLSGCGQR